MLPEPMRAYVATRDWLEPEFLPAYAPELNPVEGVRANLKGGELANLCAESTERSSPSPSSA
jgi:transposase